MAHEIAKEGSALKEVEEKWKWEEVVIRKESDYTSELTVLEETEKKLLLYSWLLQQQCNEMIRKIISYKRVYDGNGKSHL